LNVGSNIQLAKKAVLLISASRTIGNTGGQAPENIATFWYSIQFQEPTAALRAKEVSVSRA